MLKSIPVLAATLMFAAMNTSALATEWMECGDAANEVQFGILLGGLDFSQISRAHMRVGEEWWSTDPSIEPGAKPLAVADYFFYWKLLNVTAADENHETVLAQLQVIIASDESSDAKGGVLTVPGKGNWAVACEGP